MAETLGRCAGSARAACAGVHATVAAASSLARGGPAEAFAYNWYGTRRATIGRAVRPILAPWAVAPAVSFVPQIVAQCAIVILGICTAVTAQPAPRLLTTTEIVHVAVKNIDDRYLYASSQKWKKARRSIAGADGSDRAAIYALLRRELTMLRDSELHLVGPSQFAAIQRESDGETVGTGLVEFGIDVVRATGEARVVTALIGSPAALAGLRPKDVIAKINGKPTRALDHEQILDELRGGTAAELLVRRGKRSFRVRLVPSDARLQAVTTKLLPTDAGKVAYIRIAQFTPKVAESVRSEVDMFEAQRPRGYILDLRNNPGGYLEAAVDIAGVFVAGTLGEKVRRDGQVESISHDAAPLTAAAVVVLMNEGTASAAEFVAGALRGRQRALLVGMPTYGRGQTQVYVAISDGYGLTIPSALLRTPDGRLFKGTGLSPDTTVSFEPIAPAEFGRASDDPQLRVALEVITRKR